MTTIMGWKKKDGVFLAADMQVTQGNISLPLFGNKINLIGNKALIGGTGSVGAIQNVIKIAKRSLYVSKVYANSSDIDIGVMEMAQELSETNFKLPLEFKNFSTFGFLLAGMDGETPKLLSVGGEGSLINCDTFYSDGSGSQIALGLLESTYDPDLPDEEVAKKLYNILATVTRSEIYTGKGFDIYLVNKDGVKRWDIEPPKAKAKPPEKKEEIKQ